MHELVEGAASGYALVDSGGGGRLERFGDRLIARPSSVALWRRRKDAAAWDAADARFVHGQGWRFREQPLEAWVVEVGGLRLKLRLQTNGQVGMFAEHGLYLDELSEAIWSRGLRSVLNLYAYTGAATIACARAGGRVTHVDLSKKALGWAAENFAENALEAGQARLIPDDALAFLRREARRKVRYDLVIADPPSFWRLSSAKSCKLEDVLVELVSACVAVLNPERGALFLSCHTAGLSRHLLVNVCADALGQKDASIEAADLAIPEEGSTRVLPSGLLVRCRY
ncbi:MAG: class I SAM-dependent methyltransferase [Myxococcota bacterium]